MKITVFSPIKGISIPSSFMTANSALNFTYHHKGFKLSM